jgi:hypothetical protein
MHRHRHRFPARRSAERGVALVFVTFAMAALLVAITGALVTGSANSQATSNYKGASQVHFAAEAGLSEAIQKINQTGIVDFENDVIDGWSDRWGTTWHPAPISGFQYTVNPVPNGTNSAQRGRLVATARGAGNLSNVVVAEVVRTQQFATAPGAVYLATDSNVNPEFVGSSFMINGNDHTLAGGAGPGAPVPGLSTRNETNTAEVVSELNSVQQTNVQGLGYQSNPLTPSVMTSSWAPSITQMNNFVDDILEAASDAGVLNTCNDTQITNGSGCYAAGMMGTINPQNPKILYSTGSVIVKGAGSVEGAGIWIIDGDLEITGTLNYAGLIIVRGQTLVKQDPGALLNGNATVYGSLWSQDVNFAAGGNSIVNYSTEALTMAGTTVPNIPLPTTIRVLSMADCAVVPAGSNGCPS